MTELVPRDSFFGPSRTLGEGEAIFVVESPVASPREAEEFLRRLGSEVVVGGERWRPLAVSWRVPAFPVRAGETVALRCERLA